MFTSTVWSCCRVRSCSCRASASAPMRSCSLVLRSRSPVIWAMYCDVNSVLLAWISDMTWAFLQCAGTVVKSRNRMRQEMEVFRLW